jgi:hypothetical protein
MSKFAQMMEAGTMMQRLRGIIGRPNFNSKAEANAVCAKMIKNAKHRGYARTYVVVPMPNGTFQVEPRAFSSTNET